MRTIDLDKTFWGLGGVANRGIVLAHLVQMDMEAFKWFTGDSHANAISNSQKHLAGLIRAAERCMILSDEVKHDLKNNFLMKDGAELILYKLSVLVFQWVNNPAETLNMPVVYTDGTTRTPIKEKKDEYRQEL